MKKEKNKNSVAFKTPLQSTQSNLPIRDIYKGVVITKDGRYIKIIEVKPITFNLKSNEDKNIIFSHFMSMFKSAPNNIQFTAVALPANLEKQISILDEDIANEKNEKCLEVDLEYRKKLIESQYLGTSRRFFLSFSYERRVRTTLSELTDGASSLDTIVSEMRQIELNLISALKACGNQIVSFDPSDPSAATAEILYTLLNRNKSIATSFEKQRENVFNRYYAQKEAYDFYIPPTDLIAPDNISFLNPRYVVVNDGNEHDKTYYTFLYISNVSRHGYPSIVVPGWLQLYINSFQGVDVNIYAEKMDSRQVSEDIRRNLVYNRTTGYTSNGESEALDNAMSGVEAGEYLRNGVVNGGQEFYYMSILITVSGNTAKEVDTIVNRLKDESKKRDIILKECKYDEENCFYSALPLCHFHKELWNKSKKNVLTEGLASTYPFTSFEMRDEQGIYVGDDLDTGSPVLIDIFNTQKFTNPNMFICGKSGGGKSYALMLTAIRMRIKHIPVFILAPEKEHEFRRVCEALGGQFIQLGAGSPQRINVMEIFKRDESNDNVLDGNYEKLSYLSEKINSLKNFFSLLIKDISIVEKQLLDEALVETYRRFGITNDNESLYDPEDFMHKRFKKMPIISDLKAVLDEMEGTKRMSIIIGILCTGSGASFNGQTNVKLDNDFTVIGLEHLSGDVMPLGIYMAMDFVWSKVKEDRTKKKVLFIDEWWKLAYNPIAAEYSLEIAKIIRAYGGSMVLATQQVKDIFAVENGKYGEAVLNNCNIKMILPLEKADAKSVQDIIGLTQRQYNDIITANRGEAMFTSGENNLKIKFEASKVEHDLITTDRNDLIKLVDKKKKTSKEKVKKEFDYEDIFDLEEEDLTNYSVVHDVTSNFVSEETNDDYDIFDD